MGECKKCNSQEWIGYWIKVLYRNMTNLHNKKLEQYGLTTSQLSVLCQLWKEDGLTQKEIVEKLSIRPATVTGLVNTLVSKGWVEKCADIEDARIKRLYVTEKGKELEEVTLNVVYDMEEILGNNFTEEEKSLLLCWLKGLNKNVE